MSYSLTEPFSSPSLFFDEASFSHPKINRGCSSAQPLSLTGVISPGLLVPFPLLPSLLDWFGQSESTPTNLVGASPSGSHMWGRQRAPDPIMKPPCRRNMIPASDLVAGKLGVTGDSPGRSPKSAPH